MNYLALSDLGDDDHHGDGVGARHEHIDSDAARQEDGAKKSEAAANVMQRLANCVFLFVTHAGVVAVDFD